MSVQSPGGGRDSRDWRNLFSKNLMGDTQEEADEYRSKWLSPEQQAENKKELGFRFSLGSKFGIPGIIGMVGGMPYGVAGRYMGNALLDAGGFLGKHSDYWRKTVKPLSYLPGPLGLAAGIVPPLGALITDGIADLGNQRENEWARDAMESEQGYFSGRRAYSGVFSDSPASHKASFTSPAMDARAYGELMNFPEVAAAMSPYTEGPEIDNATMRGIFERAMTNQGLGIGSAGHVGGLGGTGAGGVGQSAGWK